MASAPAKLCSLIFVLDPLNSRVLLGLKKRGFGAGKFNGYGGKLEAGESMRACCSRELEEECGLRVPPAAFQRRAVLTFNMLADGMMSADGTITSRIEVHAYSCLLSEATGSVIETDEMAPEWFPIDAPPLPKMWADDEHWLPHVLSGMDVVGAFLFKDASTILSKRVEVLPPRRLEVDEQRSRRLCVDHLVYGVPGDLESAIDAFEALTGVRPAVGGVHKGLGTLNALVALGGPDDGSTGGQFGYFEILALDPAQQPTPERLWMAMDSVMARGEPRLVTWAADRSRAPVLESTSIEASVEAARQLGYDPGEVQHFARATADGATLKWKLAYRHYEESTLPVDGLVPFLIEWDSNSREAGIIPSSTAPRGIELLSLRAEAANPKAAAEALGAVGIDAADLLGDASAGGGTKVATSRIIATLRTPKGVVEIG